MAVTIYRYRKPELAVTLTAGGSLVANTTYYLTGFFQKNRTYNSVFSPFADVVSFTTDNTNKSVSVYWKVTVDIQGFEDAGGGKIRVKAASHCLSQGNTIIIEDGVYAGTYTVTTWENYHSFLITGIYSSDYTTTFRIETMHNTMKSLVLYLWTTNPFSGDPLANTWIGDMDKFSHYTWETGYLTNNFSITDAFIRVLIGTHPQIEMAVCPPPPWSAVLTKGKTWIQCTGAATSAEIRQALIDADVTDVSYLQGDTLFVYGILQSAGTLSFSDMTILVYSGMFGAPSNPNQLTLTRCSLHLLDTGYGAYMLMTANNSNFFYYVKARYPFMYMAQTYQYAVGSNNAFISPGGLGCEGMVYPASNMKIYVNPSNGVVPKWSIDCSSVNKAKFTNIEIQGSYIYLYYINSDTFPQNRLIDGLIINCPLDYDISVQNNNTKPLFNITNCNTSRTNNRKVCYTPYPFQTYTHVTDIYFWRKKTLTVLDDNGLPISGATVNLKGDDEIEYSYTTDVNGQVIYEVLEQKSLKGTSGQYFTEVYIDNYLLTISKAGYETYQSKSIYAYLLETDVTLKKAVDIMLSPTGIHIKADPANITDRELLLN